MNTLYEPAIFRHLPPHYLAINITLDCLWISFPEINMFRAQQNAFDDAVGKLPNFKASSTRSHPAAKATDENLTSENWEYILVSEAAF